jgi:hypothetical protein
LVPSASKSFSSANSACLVIGIIFIIYSLYTHTCIYYQLRDIQGKNYRICGEGLTYQHKFSFPFLANGNKKNFLLIKKSQNLFPKTGKKSQNS